LKKNYFAPILYTCLIYAFLYIPIMILIVFSFNSSRVNAVWTGFTFDWYLKLFKNREIMMALENTLTVAFASTFISTIFGTLTAYGMYRYKFRGKSVLDNLLYIPVVIPEIVLGIALLAFFSRLNIELGLKTLIIAHATFGIPFVVIVVKSRLAGFDASLEEAAADLGATQFKTFTKITLPLIAPGIIAGALLSFTLSLDDVITSFFVAGPTSTTLPLKIFSMVKFGVSPEINALSTIMLIATLSIALLGEKFKAKEIK
jgi:spermidine/putrescine transport system permease protein